MIFFFVCVRVCSYIQLKNSCPGYASYLILVFTFGSNLFRPTLHSQKTRSHLSGRPLASAVRTRGQTHTQRSRGRERFIYLYIHVCEMGGIYSEYDYNGAAGDSYFIFRPAGQACNYRPETCTQAMKN